jgi:tetratricopeptide (TPR) repeat protein
MKTVLDSVPAHAAEDRAVLGAWQSYYLFRSDFEGKAGDLVALRETRRQQLAVAERQLAKQPANLMLRRNLALAAKYYGAVLHAQKEYEGARRLYDKALSLDQAVVAAEPAKPRWKLDLSFSHASIGSLLLAQGDGNGAMSAYREALRLREDVYAADPDDEQAFSVVGRAHQSMGRVLAKTKADLAGAIDHERRVLKLRQEWEARHPSPHGNDAWQASFHWSVGDLAAIIGADTRNPAARRRQHWRRAREEYAQALGTWRELARKKPLEGDAAAKPGQLQDAIKKCDEALANLRS